MRGIWRILCYGRSKSEEGTTCSSCYHPPCLEPTVHGFELRFFIYCRTYLWMNEWMFLSSFLYLCTSLIILSSIWGIFYQAPLAFPKTMVIVFPFLSPWPCLSSSVFYFCLSTLTLFSNLHVYTTPQSPIHLICYSVCSSTSFVSVASITLSFTLFITFTSSLWSLSFY